MHGLGNDFVVFDELGGGPIPLGAESARRICDRRFGVGCDQILWLRKPRDPSCAARMEILNADGSVAEMCGNGIRAVALYLAREKKLAGEGRPGEFRIETLAGVKTVGIVGGRDAQGDQVRVDMGAPALGGGFGAGNGDRGGAPAGEELRLAGGGPALRFFEVSMGNPHAVIFVESFEGFSVAELGPRIESHPRFPARTNVEFVRVAGPRAIEVRVWERGAGITLACGTGACASAVATLATGRVAGGFQGPVEVRLPGGALQIDWAGEGRPVFMTGPAVEVFRGALEL